MDDDTIFLLLQIGSIVVSYGLMAAYFDHDRDEWFDKSGRAGTGLAAAIAILSVVFIPVLGVMFVFLRTGLAEHGFRLWPRKLD